MPIPKPRQRAGVINQAKQGKKRPRDDETDESNQLVHPIEESEDVLNASMENLDIENIQNQSTQTNFKTFCDQSTQTFDIGSSPILSSSHGYFNSEHISYLISILADSIPNYNAVQRRIVSVIIFQIFRLLKVPYNECETLLNDFNLLTIRSCSKWSNTISDEGDDLVILRDKRGSYKRILFYEEFPELEMEAKEFALEQASKTMCGFNCMELAKFINNRFRELYDFNIENEEQLVRSEESCRVDLLKWGACWDKNTNRPYFQGHERADVVIKRKEFVDYFLTNKDLYYYPMIDSENNLDWNIPTRQPKIALSHDESTFRSGEVSSERWFFPGSEPFFNKGRGRSIMVSSFIAMDSSTDIFTLSPKEWDAACRSHPELLETNSFPNYYPRSANCWIEPKKDSYFNNMSILTQFERLFILLKFKESFKGHKIEIIVDNARTHSAKIYDVIQFNKRAGTNCMYDKIEWMADDGETMIVHCFDQNREYKGLVQILKELDMIDQETKDNDLTLSQLRNILSTHKAFDDNTRLEQLRLVDSKSVQIFCLF